MRLLTGDVREVLRTLPPESVHCVVTSPPYFGLRNYGLPPSTWDDGSVCCLGLEPSPQQYVQHLVEVFREVRRVLRPDGSVWLNLGDSYVANSSKKPKPQSIHKQRFEKRGGGSGEVIDQPNCHAREHGFKPKDLLLIPHRVAIALQDDGWWVRNDIVWHKRSCLMESVKDRSTRAHEYVFHLTKSKTYYYDYFAAREPATSTQGSRNKDRKLSHQPGKQEGGLATGVPWQPTALRNWRSVWSINPQPFRGAHFAPMPVKLAERCILATTSEMGSCAACGAPFERLVTKSEALAEWKAACGADSKGEYHGTGQKDYEHAGVQNASAVKARVLEGMRELKTVGWKPTCDHVDAFKMVPCTVLDPFGGTGRVGVAADALGRDFILIDLNPEYTKLQEQQIDDARRRRGVQPPAAGRVRLHHRVGMLPETSDGDGPLEQLPLFACNTQNASVGCSEEVR